MNDVKNLVFKLFVVLLGALLALYFAGALFMVLAYGTGYIEAAKFDSAYMQRNLSLVIFFVKQLIYYTQWMIDNKTIVDFSSHGFFTLKLYGSTMLSFGIAIFILAKNYSHLEDWEPFKEGEKIHGDAKWASQRDLERANLRSKSGVLLGRDKSGYFVSSGYQHALLFAPTGSGKGVGFVIPNMLFWEESCVVHDIKLENYELTSGWREKMGQKCYVWAPADPDGNTHCYNPLDWISNKPGQMVDDVQKIGNLILPQREFWTNEARSLFVAVVLYLIAVPEKPTSFGETVRTMRSDDVAYNLAVALDTIGEYLHPVAYMNIAAFLQKADKERSGVISTLNSALELWANPLIDTATATSDFDFQTLKKQKITVYVGLTPDNIKRLENLMQIFYQQATDFMTRKIPNKEEEPYGVLFLMDEFPTLGKMDAFKAGIAYFRGYNVRLFLIIQDTQQLKGIYEEAGMNSFLSNSTYRITFSANNVETANLISQLCGNKTVESISQSKPKFLDFNPGSRSMNVSQAQRALLLPQEVMQLPKDDQILLIESFPPIKSKKIKYYEDSFFKQRLLPPSHVPTQEPYEIDSFVDQDKGDKEDTETEEI
jgi:type IV secretion system protein VirD4